MGEYDLKAAVLKIRNKRLNFSLYKGEKENQVLITPKPATQKQVTALEKECGDVKRLAKGVCFFEEGLLVFATKTKPSPAWETLLTKIFKEQQCAKFLPLTLRQLGESESDEVEVEEGGEVPPTDPDPQTTAPPPAPPPPPTATPPSAADLMAALNKIAPHVKEAVGAFPAQKDEIVKALATFQAQLKGEQLAEAKVSLGNLVGLLKSLKAAPTGTAPTPPPTGTPTPPPSTTPQPSGTPETGGLEGALGAWATARALALEQLKALESGIRGMKDPEGDAAIILVKAIQANLSARPETSLAVTELENYLTNDEIIDEAQGPNGFGVKVELRTPLLSALTKIRAALKAA